MIKKPLGPDEDCDLCQELGKRCPAHLQMDEDDRDELEELNSRKPEDIVRAAAQLMDMKCLECHGAKRMDYLVFRKAYWYLRLLGIKNIKVTEKDVPCRRCKGTGREVAEAKPLPPDLQKPSEVRTFEGFQD